MSILILGLLFIDIILVVSLVIRKRMRRKAVFLLIFGIMVVIVWGIFLYNREESVHIVSEENKIVEFNINVKKDYYGYRFYRFSTDLTEAEVLKCVQESYRGAYFDEKNQKIVFNFDGRNYKVVKESDNNWLWIKYYSYIFAEDNLEESSAKSESDISTEKLEKNTSLLELVMSDSEMFPDSMYSCIRTQQLNSDGSYIIVIKHGNFWMEDVWYVKYNGHKITYKKLVEELSGQMIISFKCISLKWGDYVEFYISSNMGNGNTYLWNVVSEEVEYEFEGLTVDHHHEGYVGQDIVEKYNLETINEEPGYGYSYVYQGDTLTSYYMDVNNDGYEDAVFYGIKYLVEDCEKFETSKILEKFYLEKVYVYHKETNKFVYSNDLSMEQLLTTD